MKKYFGGLSLVFFLFLLLPSASYGVTDLQLENLMLEFETNYGLLLKETVILRLSFSDQKKIENDLKESIQTLTLYNSKLEGNLTVLTTISSSWKARSESQTRALGESRASLNEAVSLSKEAEATYKKRVIRAYLIGGTAGALLGALITAIIIGVVK